MGKINDSNCVVCEYPIERDPNPEPGEPPFSAVGVEYCMDWALKPPAIVDIYLFHPRPRTYKIAGTENERHCEKHLSQTRQGRGGKWINSRGTARVDYAEPFFTFLENTHKWTTKASSQLKKMKIGMRNHGVLYPYPPKSQQVIIKESMYCQEDLREVHGYDHLISLKKWHSQILQKKRKYFDYILVTPDDAYLKAGVDYHYILTIKYYDKKKKQFSVATGILEETFLCTKRHGPEFLEAIISLAEKYKWERTKAIRFLDSHFEIISKGCKTVLGKKPSVDVIAELCYVLETGQLINVEEKKKAVRQHLKTLSKKNSKPNV